MLSQITQTQQPKTLKYSTPLKNEKNNNPSFKSLGALGTQTLNFLNTSPAIGACFVDFFSMVMPQVLMGVGIILVFVPVSALALGTLPKQELSAGASLHNLCKSTTMAVVASISSTLVARHAQIHQVYLVKNLSEFTLAFQTKFAALLHTFLANASSSYATAKANAYLYKSLLAQSRLMAYVDVFSTFALLAFLLIPLAFLLKCI